MFATVAYSDVVALVFLASTFFLLFRNRIIKSSITIAAAILTFYNLAWTLPSFAFDLLKGGKIRNLLFYCAPLATGILLLLWFKLETGQYFPLLQLEQPWSVAFGSPIAQAQYLLCQGGTGSFTCQAWAVDGIALKPITWVVRNVRFEAFYLYGAFYLLKTKLEHRVFLFAYCLSVILPLFFLLGVPAMSVPRLLLPAFPVFIGNVVVIEKIKIPTVYVVLACYILAAVISVIEFFAFFCLKDDNYNLQKMNGKVIHQIFFSQEG